MGHEVADRDIVQFVPFRDFEHISTAAIILYMHVLHMLCTLHAYLHQPIQFLTYLLTFLPFLLLLPFASFSCSFPLPWAPYLPPSGPSTILFPFLPIFPPLPPSRVPNSPSLSPSDSSLLFLHPLFSFYSTPSQASPAALAKAVLAEIPQQLTEYMRNNKILPMHLKTST